MLIAFAAVLLSAALVGAQRMGSREQGSNLEMCILHKKAL